MTKTKSKERWTKDEDCQLVELWSDGASVTEAAFSTDRSTVRGGRRNWTKDSSICGNWARRMPKSAKSSGGRSLQFSRGLAD